MPWRWRASFLYGEEKAIALNVTRPDRSILNLWHKKARNSINPMPGGLDQSAK